VPAPDSDVAAAQKIAGFDRDSIRRLEIYAHLLRRWQPTINLVAPNTLPVLWTRHFADSWQVSDAAPSARRWVDLGSGGGFPGLVTAIRLADSPGAQIDLIDSDRRKCAFLREVSRETGVPARIHCGRIEDILPSLEGKIDALSARALAPLQTLLDFAVPIIAEGAVGIFMKGKDADRELTGLSHPDTILLSSIASTTATDARLIVVRRREPAASDPVS
jgi:16S rRNA (guanine527-N7)-methyltransferase